MSPKPTLYIGAARYQNTFIQEEDMSIETTTTCAIITPCDQVYSIFDQMKDILNQVIKAEEGTNAFFQNTERTARDVRTYAEQVQAAKEICLEAKNVCLKSMEELNKNSTWSGIYESTAKTANNIWNTIQPIFANEIALTAEIGISLIAAGKAIYDYRNGNDNWKRYAAAAGTSGLLAVTSYFMLPKKA